MIQRKRIGIDIQSTFKQMTGIGQYTTHLVQSLASIDGENDYYLTGYIPWYKVEKRRRGIQPPSGNFKRAIQWIPPRFRNPTDGLDLFHTSHVNGFSWISCRMIFTVMDCSWRGYPEGFSQALRNCLDEKMREASQKAGGFIAISESTRNDFLKYFPVAEKKVKVIPLAASEAFRLLPDREASRADLLKYGISFPYLLFVGSFEPVKNVPGLLRAFHAIHREIPHHLVCVGVLRQRREEILMLLAELGLEERVHLIGYVPLEDLVVLYNLADLFVFPSFYEGFGLPILEAFRCGTPVLASRNSSMPEVAGEAAYWVNPFEIEDISKGIRELIQNRGLRESLSQKGLLRANSFSWKKTALETLSLFQEVLG